MSALKFKFNQQPKPNKKKQQRTHEIIKRDHKHRLRKEKKTQIFIPKLIVKLNRLKNAKKN